MNLTESDPFQKLKSTNSSNHFASSGLSSKTFFQGRVSLAVSRVEQRWRYTPKNIKSTKQTFPSFRENYVGSDFSIARCRYVGIKSTHFIEPKKQIKQALFSSPQIQTFNRYRKHLHTNICKEVPVEYHGCRGCLTPSLCITNPRTRKLFKRDFIVIYSLPLWIK